MREWKRWAGRERKKLAAISLEEPVNNVTMTIQHQNAIRQYEQEWNQFGALMII